jgi:hypothetical protein
MLQKPLYLGSVAIALAVVAFSTPAYAQLATGPDATADGYLRVGVDATGSWASTTFGGAGDLFNPAGAGLAGAEVGFSAGLFLFAGNGDREVLTTNATYRNVTNDGTINNPTVNSFILSDMVGADGVNDTATSNFTVVSGAMGSGMTNLTVDLVQKVRVAVAGVSASIEQNYTFTNNLMTPITLNLVRAFDGDLVWSGDFTNDEVGTTMHGAGLGTYVYEQEDANAPETAISLSSPEATIYYGGKNGVDPLGAGFPFGYGTDTQVWASFGTPANWVNFIAGVGANVNGESGTMPPGSSAVADGFVGIELAEMTLAGGASGSVTVIHTYGQQQPVPEPSAVVLTLGLFLGALAWRRMR